MRVMYEVHGIGRNKKPNEKRKKKLTVNQKLEPSLLRKKLQKEKEQPAKEE